MEFCLPLFLTGSVEERNASSFTLEEMSSQ